MVICLPSADRPPTTASHRVRVLVVDDGQGATAGVRDLLAGEDDLLVTSARSAADAEALLVRGGFEAAILEPRFWEGEQGYLRPVLQDDPHQAAPILVTDLSPRPRWGAPECPTVDTVAMREGTNLADLVRTTVRQARDARRKQTMMRWVERDANTDDLTGLHTRKALDEQLAEACAAARRENRPVGLLLMNVVGTGPVNEVHGLEAGDGMLRRAAAGITRSIRGIDFAARLVDDDFAVILPGADLDLVRRIARRITHELERMNSEDWADELPVSVSFGVASGVGCSARRLLAAAEQQLADHDHHATAAPSRLAPAIEYDNGPSVA